MPQPEGNFPLKVLHIGVTGRGEWPLRLCSPITGFQSVALCDVNSAALEKARAIAELPATACFTDLDEAIRTSGADCAIVCTPTAYHVPIGLKLIAAGMPALIEKGMAPDWASAVKLTTAAREKGAIVAIAQNYRYRALEKTIWNAVQDPAFPAHVGKVHQVSYSEQRVRPEPRTLTYPFASIWDMSCHHFDNLQFWFGPVEQVTAFSWKADWSAYRYDNNTSAYMRCANGTNVHYIHTHDGARYDLEIQVHGEKGALFYRNRELVFSERPLVNFTEKPLIPVVLQDASDESDMLRDFHSYIVEKKEPGISAQNNLSTMAACEMMTRSLVEKRTVTRSEISETV